MNDECRRPYFFRLVAFWFMGGVDRVGHKSILDETSQVGPLPCDVCFFNACDLMSYLMSSCLQCTKLIQSLVVSQLLKDML